MRDKKSEDARKPFLSPAARLCSITETDLTHAITALGVYQFGPFGVPLGPTDPEDGDGYVGNPLYAVMTHSHSQINRSYDALKSLLNGPLTAAAHTHLAIALIPYLDPTSGDYEELLSGEHSMSGDEQPLVKALSHSVALTLHSCGPSKKISYAPEQERAYDIMSDLTNGPQNVYDPASYNYSYVASAVKGYVSQTKSTLRIEIGLKALGPQGDGGGCTVSQQMYNQASETTGSQSGFEQDLGSNGLASSYNEASSLQSLISTIIHDGLMPPAGAEYVVQHTRTGVKSGVAEINSKISVENSLVTQAYSLANSMATHPAAAVKGRASYSGSCKPQGWPIQPPPMIGKILK